MNKVFDARSYLGFHDVGAHKVCSCLRPLTAKMRLAVAASLLLLFLLLIMPQCLLCGETFTKMQGLTRHKNSCSGSQRAIRTSSRAQRIALPRLQKAKLQRKRDGKEAVVERQELREAINQVRTL